MYIICPCMYTQQEDGSEKCRFCHGDVHACDCPLLHSTRCEEHPNHKENNDVSRRTEDQGSA